MAIEKTDVVIVGVGAAGGILAAELAKAGMKVIGLEGLRRAQEAAAPFGLPVMIHMGQSVSPMRAILPLLKRGDIVTHMYAPAPNAILDEEGRLFPEVAAARRRGVIFDL